MRMMVTGTELGGIRMTFQGISRAAGSKFEIDAV